MQVKNTDTLPGLDTRKSEFSSTAYHDVAIGFGVTVKWDVYIDSGDKVPFQALMCLQFLAQKFLSSAFPRQVDVCPWTCLTISSVGFCIPHSVCCTSLVKQGIYLIVKAGESLVSHLTKYLRMQICIFWGGIRPFAHVMCFFPEGMALSVESVLLPLICQVSKCGLAEKESNTNL